MSGDEVRTRDGRQPQRWRVLEAVASVGEPATVDEVVDELRDRRVPNDPLGDLESWDRTHERLHDVELPALDAAGLLTFDDERGVVTVPPAANAGPFATAAATDTPGVTGDPAPSPGRPTGTDDATGTNDGTSADRGDADRSAGRDGRQGRQAPGAGSSDDASSGDVAWQRRYLAATVVGVGLLLASTSTLAPGGELATTVAGGLVVALFATIAVAHALSTR